MLRETPFETTRSIPSGEPDALIEYSADRPLYDQNGFSTTIASNINDLPTISPHGSDFGETAQIVGLAGGRNATYVTATAHHYTLCGIVEVPRSTAFKVVGVFSVALSLVLSVFGIRA